MFNLYKIENDNLKLRIKELESKINTLENQNSENEIRISHIIIIF